MLNSEDAVTSYADTPVSGDEDDGVSNVSGSVSCSICLEVLVDDGSRSWAMLQCGHQFHLDCIGSAFNVKGAMQCPNCRKIEKGQWLYANGSRPYPEWSMDDLNHDEDHYDLSYSEVSVGVHWCPFGHLARFGQLAHFTSASDDGEIPFAAYHEIFGQHAILADHTTVSAASHPCPYVAYLQPIHPLENFSGSVSDGSSSNSQWNGPRIANEMPTSYAFPTMDVNYHGWEHHCPPLSTGSSNVSAADQLTLPLFPQRSARATSDITGPGSFLQPPSVGYSSAGRAGSSLVPPYLGSNARTQDRVQALQGYYHSQATDSPATQNPMISSIQRANSQRGSTQVGPTVSSTDHTGGFFIYPSATGHNFQDPVNPQLSYFRSWEIDQTPPFSSNQTDRAPNWGPFYQSPPLSSPVIRFRSFHQRHGSERTS